MRHLEKLIAKNPKALKQFLLPKTANLFDTNIENLERVKVSDILHCFPNSMKKAFVIRYTEAETKFGKALAASTSDGLCFLGWDSDSLLAVDDVKKRFPEATFTMVDDEPLHQLAFLRLDGNDVGNTLTLALYGTDFQCSVWKRLSEIPNGSLLSYLDLAKEMGDEKLSRAIGTAIGSNPFASVIPCHRVVQNTGGLGGYMWGLDRKIALLSEELNFENY